MAAWTSDELKKIGSAEELEIASLRRDGTLRDPVTIWVVRVVDDLYIRAYKGRTSPWYRGTQSQHAGHIRAGGVDKDVAFEEADGDSNLNDRIDAAYLRKYRGHSPSSLDPMVTPTARTATIRLLPR